MALRAGPGQTGPAWKRPRTETSAVMLALSSLSLSRARSLSLATHLEALTDCPPDAGSLSLSLSPGGAHGLPA